MKKRVNIIAILVLTAALAALAFGCNDKPDSDIRVDTTTDSVTLTVYEVMGYDYASLFKITDKGAEVPVENSYLSKKGLAAEPGEYTVSCTYNSVTASVKIIVVEEQEKPRDDVYTLTLSVDSVRINANSVDTYDFKALFTLKINNKVSAVTDDMVSSTVQNVAGNYTYTVTAGKVSKTLEVIVWEHPKVEMIACYALKEIPENESDDFDFTDLFMLYLSGKAERVTDDMLSGVPNVLTDGQEFTVSALYNDGHGNIDKASVAVKIVAAKSVAVSSKDITTYPNAEYIDLTSLFEITYGGERVETTIDMISGNVDYTKAGENIITLTYDNTEYTAKITVVLGVVIQYAKADTVTVVQGTDKNAYPFGDDFIVTVNGIRFTDIEEFIDTTDVDFSRPGTYTAQIKIPYNTEALGWGVVNFDYFEEEITYVVTDKLAVVTVKDKFVTLPSDTAVYGVQQISQNVSVTLNGTPCILVVNPDWTVGISTNIYVDIIAGVDTDNKGDQNVVLDLYTHGIEASPERVEYTVRISSDISVVAHDYAVFVGGTVYTRDLFEITVNGIVVDISEAEITGKIDVFEPGVYEITADYDGIIAIAYVTVFDKSLQGTYKTTLKEIPAASDDDDDDSEDLGWGDEWGAEGYSLAPRADSTAVLGDMVISDDGIVVSGIKATNVSGLNSDIMTLSLGSNVYTMYLNNGIAVLDPDNSNKLMFSNYRRPMIYFSSALWKIEKSITINYGSSHVLQNNTMTYSIDCFRIVPIGGNTASAQWYGLKVHLVSKTSADTEYRITWGEVTFADNFLNAADYLNLNSSCVFNDEVYEFNMETRVIGKVKKLESKKLYAGKEFHGTVDGKDAVLRADGTERFSLQIDSKTVISSFGNESDYTNSMVNGGPDYDKSTLRLNAFGGRTGNDEDGIFSYKFNLDLANNTFTVAEKDDLYGRYETADGKMYIFIDGYGYGCISFDSSSYARINFSYSVSGNEVTLRFSDAKSSVYGDSMSLFVAPILNVLTVKESRNIEFGTVFTMLEQLISDGAIVEIIDTKITAVNTADQVRAAVRIVDKNGEWTASQKKSAVKVDFVGSKSGFYLVTVSVSVGNKTVATPYAFQVFENKFSSYSIVCNYGNGTMFNDNKLSMDTYGRVTLDVGGIVFIGAVTYADGNKFITKMHNAAGEFLCGVGESVADGIIKFTATGSAPFTDYFTTGSSRVIGKTGVGIEGLVLREFTVSGKKTYTVAASATAIGETATVRIISGSEQLTTGTVIEISYGSKVRRATIGAWNNTTEGLYDVTP